MLKGKMWPQSTQTIEYQNSLLRYMFTPDIVTHLLLINIRIFFFQHIQGIKNIALQIFWYGMIEICHNFLAMKQKTCQSFAYTKKHPAHDFLLFKWFFWEAFWISLPLKTERYPTCKSFQLHSVPCQTQYFPLGTFEKWLNCLVYFRTLLAHIFYGVCS